MSETNRSVEIIKPSVLYHSSENRNIEELEPRKEAVRDPKEGPRFRYPRQGFSLNLLSTNDDSWTMKGAFNHILHTVISNKERFTKLDHGGAIYHLLPDTFETDPHKGMRKLEWTSKLPVKPIAQETFESDFEAMLELGVQVYFVDKPTFEAIKTSQDHGLTILQSLPSENQKLNKNAKDFIK